MKNGLVRIHLLIKDKDGKESFTPYHLNPAAIILVGEDEKGRATVTAGSAVNIFILKETVAELLTLLKGEQHG